MAVLFEKKSAPANPQRARPTIRKYMEEARAHINEPTADNPMPNMNNRRLPMQSEINPEGISMKTPARNQADITYPTRAPDRSKSFTRIGKKAPESRIPKKMENPINNNS